MRLIIINLSHFPDKMQILSDWLYILEKCLHPCFTQSNTQDDYLAAGLSPATCAFLLNRPVLFSETYANYLNNQKLRLTQLKQNLSTSMGKFLIGFLDKVILLESIDQEYTQLNQNLNRLLNRAKQGSTNLFSRLPKVFPKFTFSCEALFDKFWKSKS